TDPSAAAAVPAALGRSIQVIRRVLSNSFVGNRRGKRSCGSGNFSADLCSWKEIYLADCWRDCSMDLGSLASHCRSRPLRLELPAIGRCGLALAADCAKAVEVC